MSQARSQSAADLHPGYLSTLSCDACRTKKLKCSRQRPSCSACLQNHRPCHYSARSSRSPLTRVYLTSVEKRLKYLEKLVADKLPDVDTEDAPPLEGSASARQGSLTGAGESATGSGPADSSVLGEHPTQFSASKNDESILDAVPDEADGFDWQEEANELVDGMASLSVEPTGAGYLGSTAGVFFLRALLSWVDSQRPHALPEQLAALSPARSRPPPSLPSDMQLSLDIGQTVHHLLNAYFSIYHPSYPFVHEATFMAQHAQLLPRPNSASWQALFHTILALGAWCLSSSGDSKLEDYLYHRAISFREDESLFENANMTVVQALVLLSNLSQKRNRPNTGGNLLGLATRMALSLGLHRELPAWNIGLLQREMRRRAWWGLYMFDSGAATTFGRPILLPSRDAMDVKYVLNTDDEHLNAQTTVQPQESSQPTIYSGMKTQCDFHVHTNYISNRLLTPSGISVDETIRLNENLEQWTKTLPSYFQLDADDATGKDAVGSGTVPNAHQQDWYLFSRARLWWRIWNLQIILTRHVLLRRATTNAQAGGNMRAPSELENKCRSVSVQAARNTIKSVHEFLGQVRVTRLINWYATNFLFQAGLISVLAILAEPTSPFLSTRLADVKIATATFREILADNNPLANRCADILAYILASAQLQGPGGGGNAQQDLTQGLTVAPAAEPGPGLSLEGLIPPGMYGDDFDMSSWIMDPNDGVDPFGWVNFPQGI